MWFAACDRDRDKAFLMFFRCIYKRHSLSSRIQRHLQLPTSSHMSSRWHHGRRLQKNTFALQCPHEATRNPQVPNIVDHVVGCFSDLGLLNRAAMSYIVVSRRETKRALDYAGRKNWSLPFLPSGTGICFMAKARVTVADGSSANVRPSHRQSYPHCS